MVVKKVCKKNVVERRKTSAFTELQKEGKIELKKGLVEWNWREGNKTRIDGED